MNGLIVERGINAADYLTYVHDIPVEEFLGLNPALEAMLSALPLRRAVYTNANTEYSWRVLRALGVADHFERVIGIEDVGLRNKFHREAYEQALTLLGVRGPECIMVEDTVRNLRPAKALGLTTVLVDVDGSATRQSVRLSAHAAGSPKSERSRRRLAEMSDESVDFVVGDVLQVGQVVSRLLAPAGPQSSGLNASCGPL